MSAIAGMVIKMDTKGVFSAGLSNTGGLLEQCDPQFENKERVGVRDEYF